MLDMNYAVGRIAFDRPEQYRRYVEGLIAYEKAGAAPNGREVLYWGPRNRADRATQLSADCLIRPLFNGIPATGDQTALPAIAEQCRFRSRCLGGPDATRANLLEPLHAVEVGRRPAFLFTASHGLVWPNGHESQMAEEGGAALARTGPTSGSAAPLGALPEGRRPRRRRAAPRPGCLPVRLPRGRYAGL